MSIAYAMLGLGLGIVAASLDTRRAMHRGRFDLTHLAQTKALGWIILLIGAILVAYTRNMA